MNQNNRDYSIQTIQEVLETGNTTGNNQLLFPTGQATTSFNTIRVGNTSGVPTSAPSTEGWFLYDSTNNNAYVFGNGVWSRIYSTGSVPTLQEVTTAGATTNQNLTFNSNLQITGNVSNPGGNVTVQDNLDVTGTIDVQGKLTNTTAPNVINIDVPLRNVSGGDLVLSDNVTITGNLNIQGSIANAVGSATFDDSVTMPVNQPQNTTKLFKVTTVNGIPTSTPADGSICYDQNGDLYYVRQNGVWTNIWTNAYGPSLSQVMLVGNTTGAVDLSVNSGQKVRFAGGNLTIDNSADSKPVLVGYNNATNSHPVIIGNNNRMYGVGIAIGRSVDTGTTSPGQNYLFGTSIGGTTATANCYDNIAIGFVCLGSNAGTITSAQGNISIGGGTLAPITSGSYNVAVGHNAGAALTTGTNNVYVGANAGNTSTTGTQNVIVGYNADVNASGNTNATAVGYNSIGCTDSAILGRENNAVTYTGVIALGHGNTATKNGQMFIGGATSPVNTATTVGPAGGASSLPATPKGYLTVTINGTEYKIPYYLP